MKVKDNDCIYCEKNYGLMICCERCEGWYHFKCVNKKWDLNLPRSQLHYLADYYCYPCRRANPSLKLKYYSSNNFNSGDFNLKTATKPSRRSRKEQPPLTKTNNTANNTTETNRSKPIRVPSPLQSSSSSCRYIFSSKSSPISYSSNSTSTSTASSPASSSSSSCSHSCSSSSSSSTFDQSSRTSSPMSSSSKSDEAIENKKPTMTFTTTTVPIINETSVLRQK